ncbi:MAG: hypothetical protein P4L73_13370 [Caulobacteraceae bacterium]|nr:hypothetical protein [Caulobacteraceae bacterium]
MPGLFGALGLFLFEVATDVGIPISIAATIANVGALAAIAGIAIGVGEALFGNSSPKPEGLRETVRQAIPPRRRGCGVARLGGAYLLDYAQGQMLYRVVAFADSKPESVLAYYLSQDEVTLSGIYVNQLANGAYPGNRESIETCWGVTGVNAFSDLTAEIPAVWPATCYGTGIFMGYLRCGNGDLTGYATRFPRGKPTLNVAARLGPVYDWRDGTQSQTNAATWKVSTNPVVNLVHELWNYRGYDWTIDFVPTLSILTAEANVCDTLVETLNVLVKIVVKSNAGATSVVIASGPTPPIGTVFYVGGQQFTVSSVAGYSSGGVTGYLIGWSSGSLLAQVQIGDIARWQATPANPVTEPTYACGGAWNVDEAEADTVKRFLDAMDGWMQRRGSDGAVVIRAGHYYDPTVVIGPDEVISYTWQPFVEAGKSVNQVIPAFVCPALDYSQVDTTPWQDDADIAVNGLSSQPFQPDMVQSNGQVRRLAKRRLHQLITHAETITLKASGLRALGERYIRLQLWGAEVTDLEDIVVEIVGDGEIINNGMAITFQIAAADQTIDTWDAYTDEGSGPAAVSAPAQGALDVPTITALTPFDELSSSGVDGIRLEVDADPPAGFTTRDDLTWLLQWRVVGATSWNGQTYLGLPAGSVVMDTAFVPVDVTIEVQIAFQTGGGQISPWTVSSTVYTSTAGIAPGPPTSLSVNSPAAGDTSMTWRNPSSSSFDHARVHRGTTSTFSSATDVSGALPGSSGAVEAFTQTGLATGTYYYWVTAENASNVASSPDGPQSVAVA